MSSVFEIKKSDGKARIGVLRVKDKELETPFYMPVATKGAVKNMTPEMLSESRVQCIISNAFVLSLKPGIDVVKKAGGLHKFINWKGGIFTDSGGFQVLSDGFLESLEDQGVIFKNPFTGLKKMFTPEDSMDAQLSLDSDVAMTLDDVPHYGKSREYIIETLRRTHAWAERCKRYHDEHKREKKSGQLLFGIAQGGTFKELRRESAERINDLGFDGVAFGGLAIGEGREKMFESITTQIEVFDSSKPRYFMGLGSPDDMLEAIGEGVDIFDSVFPTRSARRGTLFTREGSINIGNKRFEYDFSKVDESCDCYACRNYTKAFIRHLFKTHDLMATILVSTHNIRFMQKMIEDAKDHIRAGTFEKFKSDFIRRYRKE